MREKHWWKISAIVSFALILVLMQLWSIKNQYILAPDQLTDEAAVEKYLKAHWENRPAAQSQPTIKIRTGIFVQSLKFFNSTEVNVSGYIWQHYEDGVHDTVKPGPEEVGFVLPEQVNTGSDIDPRIAYRHREEGGEVIGWYFEATLRQPFEYSQYPFDHKTVWIRLWAKDFNENVVLVPDFDAYRATDKNDIFGIEKTIVLGTWERENTFFDYRLSSYDTNFGLRDYIGQDGFPELHYNFLIKRKFENAFTVHLLPLFLVSALLFGALLTVSAVPELSDKHGFSTSGVIGTCSALFFVVLLAHIQLREQFAGSHVVYMEQFYFLMYGLLVLAAVNTYLFSMNAAPWLKVIHYRDNLFPKVAFWPVVLGSMVVITLMSL